MRIVQGWIVTLIAFVITLPLPLLADVQYAYDDAGRLVQVVAQDGSSAQYVYDAAGNISAITRFTANQLALSSFTPGIAAVGAQITIRGSGFSPTAGDNVVSFNGATANVVSASPNKLIVQVPAEATTGAISINVSSVMVSSDSDFVVIAPPTITAIVPNVADLGATVTVAGSNLEPIPDSTEVSIASTPAPLASSAQTQIAIRVPAAAQSGTIAVATPHGEAISTTRLIIPPVAIGAANVASSGDLVLGAGAQSLTITGTSYGVFAFDASAGQYLSIQLSALSTAPSGQIVYYVLYAPGNVQIVSASVSQSTMSIHLPRISSTGTHLIAFIGANTTSVSLSASIEENPILDSGQAPLLSTTTVPAQSKRYVINAAAGQHLGVGISDVTLSSGSLTLNVGGPQGNNLGGQTCGSGVGAVCGLSMPNLAHTGAYLATVGGNGTAAFKIRVTPAVTGTLLANTPFNLNLPNPGQFAMLSYEASENETLSLHVGSIVTTPSQNVHVAVFNPSNAQVVAGPAGTFSLTNLTAGTYKIQVSPYNGGLATAQLIVTSGSILRPTDGSSANFSTSVNGQSLHFSFDANAGDDIGIGVSNLTTSAGGGSVGMSVKTPSGGYLNGTNCSASSAGGICGLSLVNLPATGRYQVTFTAPSTGTMSLTFTLSHAVNDQLTIGSPFNLSLPRYGQFAMLTFTATTGQSLTLDVSSIATSPSQSVWVAVLNSSNATIASGGSGGSLSRALTNLAAGTYTIQLSPYYGGTASATVHVH